MLGPRQATQRCVRVQVRVLICIHKHAHVYVSALVCLCVCVCVRARVCVLICLSEYVPARVRVHVCKICAQCSPQSRGLHLGAAAASSACSQSRPSFPQSCLLLLPASGLCEPKLFYVLVYLRHKMRARMCVRVLHVCTLSDSCLYV